MGWYQQLNPPDDNRPGWRAGETAGETTAEAEGSPFTAGVLAFLLVINLAGAAVLLAKGLPYAAAACAGGAVSAMALRCIIVLLWKIEKNTRPLEPEKKSRFGLDKGGQP